MVFEHEILGAPEKSSDHPSFRTRILQIYKLFNPDNYSFLLSQIVDEKEEKKEVAI
jgi:hypothetical protein